MNWSKSHAQRLIQSSADRGMKAGRCVEPRQATFVVSLCGVMSGLIRKVPPMNIHDSRLPLALQTSVDVRDGQSIDARIRLPIFAQQTFVCPYRQSHSQFPNLPLDFESRQANTNNRVNFQKTLSLMHPWRQHQKRATVSIYQLP